jgi:hypothetical protein
MKHQFLTPLICLSLGFCALPASAQFVDNFNDGDDAGWTRFTPVVGSTFSFPASSQGGLGYQMTSPPTTPAGRVGSIYTAGALFADFLVTVDLVNWDNNLRQEMGLMSRVQAAPTGLLPNGYSMIYVNRFSAGGGGTDQLRIYRDSSAGHTLLTGSDGQFAQAPNVTPPPNPATGDYQLIFGGQGSLLWGQVKDLSSGLLLEFSTGSGPVTNTIWATDATYTSGMAGLLAVAGTGSDPSVNPVFDNFSITIVPEPSSAALMGLGLLSLAVVRKVRRSRSKV